MSVEAYLVSFFWLITFGVLLVTIPLVILIIKLAIQAHKMPIVSGREEMIGSTGNVMMVPKEEGMPRVRIRGELWQVKSRSPLYEGLRVRVIDIEELILVVVPDERDDNSTTFI